MGRHTKEQKRQERKRKRHNRRKFKSSYKSEGSTSTNQNSTHSSDEDQIPAVHTQHTSNSALLENKNKSLDCSKEENLTCEPDTDVSDSDNEHNALFIDKHFINERNSASCRDLFPDPNANVAKLEKQLEDTKEKRKKSQKLARHCVDLVKIYRDKLQQCRCPTCKR